MPWPSWLSLPQPNDARPRPSASPSTSRPSSSPTPATAASQSQSKPQLPPSAPPLSESPAYGTPQNPTLIQRNRALSLLLFGTAFTLLSARLTKRSITKRQSQIRPHFWHPSNEAPLVPISGAFEAVEALSLATVNVVSWAMVWTGGVLWAFGINGVEDMRRRVRGGLGVEEERAGNEERADREIEEWMARVLERGVGRGAGKGDVGELGDILERGEKDKKIDGKR
ncbi:MAG: hypothetical protein MMC23_001279 [Stictis urceolatum]|nr:hypothetical protein [Stictis urceolata]